MRCGERVVGGAARFAAEVVAALIGDDYAEANVGERLDLLVPGIPKFGEAVEENGDRAVWRAGGDGVEFGWRRCERSSVRAGIARWGVYIEVRWEVQRASE